MNYRMVSGKMLLVTMEYVFFCCGHFCAGNISVGSELTQKDDLLSSSHQLEGIVGYFLLWISWTG